MKTDSTHLVELKKSQKVIRKNTSLFRAPITTIKILALSLYEDLLQALLYMQHHKNTAIISFLTLCALSVIWILPGPHQGYIVHIQDFVTLVSWWIMLGILSSVGLGTGLHTFLLYLGPFMAQVTLAATECKTTQFERYGPSRFLCPAPSYGIKIIPSPSIVDILPLVWFEAFLWGAGTAIGELPPYFLARAARQSGKKLEEIEQNDDDEEVEEKETLMKRLNDKMDVFLKKYFVTQGYAVKFTIIMLFASIPNPLFDLAGLTCGYQLVPFALFFLPTLIGKGVFKVTIQSLFVISVFKKDTLEYLLNVIENWAPFIKGTLQTKFAEVKQQFHRMPGEGEAGGQKASIAIVWDVILALMVSYFIVSIVDYKVQAYLVQQHLAQAKALEDQVLGQENKKKD